MKILTMGRMENPQSPENLIYVRKSELSRMAVGEWKWKKFQSTKITLQNLKFIL